MLNDITLTGEYLGNDITGIMVGGKVFVKNLVQETKVNEDTFKNLLKAVENKWFDIKDHNYDEYLASRGIVSNEKIVTEVKPVEEKVEEKVEEVTEQPVNEVVEEVTEQPVNEVVEEVTESTESTESTEEAKEVKAAKGKKRATKEETPVKED